MTLAHFPTDLSPIHVRNVPLGNTIRLRILKEASVLHRASVAPMGRLPFSQDSLHAHHVIPVFLSAPWETKDVRHVPKVDLRKVMAVRRAESVVQGVQ